MRRYGAEDSIPEPHATCVTYNIPPVQLMIYLECQYSGETDRTIIVPLCLASQPVQPGVMYFIGRVINANTETSLIRVRRPGIALRKREMP